VKVFPHEYKRVLGIRTTLALPKIQVSQPEVARG